MCLYFPVTSEIDNIIPKDMCISNGLHEDPTNCRNYYWCQVNISSISRSELPNNISDILSNP